MLDNGAYHTVSVAIDHNVDELLVGLVCECLRVKGDAIVPEEAEDIDNDTTDITVNRCACAYVMQLSTVDIAVMDIMNRCHHNNKSRPNRHYTTLAKRHMRQ